MLQTKLRILSAAILATCMLPLESVAQAALSEADLEALRRIPDDAPPVVMPAAGPYPVTLSESPDLPDFTIYAPTPITGGRERFAVVAWGNGGCANANANAREFLTTVASHGFVVIAPGALDATEGGRTNSVVQIEALDWAERENARQGGLLYGRIAADNAAVMGRSCGGLQSLENATDPRVRSVALFNSGATDAMPEFLRRAADFDKSDLAGLRTPIMYLIGGPVDPAWANAEDDFTRIDHVPLFNGNAQTGHLGTFAHPGGGMQAGIASRWLEWTLYGDAKAGRMFSGENCGLCTDPVWRVKRKNM